MDCILWTGPLDRSGYGKRKYKGRMWQAHRAAYDEQVGPIPEGAFILHSCDVRACINVEHLRPGTHAENMTDRNGKGRQAWGERNRNAKLTAAQVREIRRRHESGVSQKELAEEYQVGANNISFIVNRVTWKLVD